MKPSCQRPSTQTKKFSYIDVTLVLIAIHSPGRGRLWKMLPGSRRYICVKKSLVVHASSGKPDWVRDCVKQAGAPPLRDRANLNTQTSACTPTHANLRITQRKCARGSVVPLATVSGDPIGAWPVVCTRTALEGFQDLQAARRFAKSTGERQWWAMYETCEYVRTLARYLNPVSGCTGWVKGKTRSKRLVQRGRRPGYRVINLIGAEWNERSPR